MGPWHTHGAHTYSQLPSHGGRFPVVWIESRGPHESWAASISRRKSSGPGHRVLPHTASLLCLTDLCSITEELCALSGVSPPASPLSGGRPSWLLRPPPCSSFSYRADFTSSLDALLSLTVLTTSPCHLPVWQTTDPIMTSANAN